MSPREKIASKDYIDQHYYERPNNGKPEFLVEPLTTLLGVLRTARDV